MGPSLLLLVAVAGWQVPPDSTVPAAIEPVLLPAGHAGVVADSDTAALVVHGTTVAVFRSRLGAATPAERAEAAARRIDAILAQGGAPGLRLVPVAEGVAVEAGGRPLFVLAEGDGDPAAGETPAHMGAQAVVALRGAMHLEGRERSLAFLLRASLMAVLATILFAAAVVLLRRLVRAAVAHIPVATRRLPAVTIRGFTVLRPRQAGHALIRTLVGGAWVVGALLAYAWLTFVLMRFPVSRPWGEALGGFLVLTVRDLALGAVKAVPGLITVVIIFIAARWLGRLIGGFFTAVEGGRVQVPWVHAETAQPTRRIALVLLWLFAIVVAYPYLPGSGSAAFKGVSVFLGLVLSLGSTGLVNQAMSGLVVMYARSFRVGDYVRIGDVEGEVTTLALLSTKIRTTKNEEVTLPNAAILSGGTVNYSRLAAGPGLILYTGVTIGYDTPWRQVHALLTLAASRTPGLRTDPPPFVLQTALGDFYVEYQLNARLERAADRIPVRSALHANILDAFNEYGVQIMSPHFETQPTAAVTVPRERWHAAPAADGSGDGAEPTGVVLDRGATRPRS